MSSATSMAGARNSAAENLHRSCSTGPKPAAFVVGPICVWLGHGAAMGLQRSCIGLANRLYVRLRPRCCPATSHGETSFQSGHRHSSLLVAEYRRNNGNNRRGGLKKRRRNRARCQFAVCERAAAHSAAVQPRQRRSAVKYDTAWTFPLQNMRIV
jgi:hypothetical protein